jgi:hypothetical protein
MKAVIGPQFLVVGLPIKKPGVSFCHGFAQPSMEALCRLRIKTFYRQ